MSLLSSLLLTLLFRAADLSYETHDQWEVPRDTIVLGALLGQGQYGEVYRGIYKGNIAVAVKTLKASTNPKDFLAEAAIMKVSQKVHVRGTYLIPRYELLLHLPFVFNFTAHLHGSSFALFHTTSPLPPISILS